MKKPISSKKPGRQKPQPYNPNRIEIKWQKKWEKSGIYRAKDNSKLKKFYSLIEFPYPSGQGLHVGHIRSNTAMDIISRKRRREGYNVLYPIGWDAFGLPTENYAIKTGIQPAIVTKKNTDIFRRQLKRLGFSFDWSREINTTDPKYYKWTQWIFLQFLKKGLAYKAKMSINWCPKDMIGLANEEVVSGRCERCGTPVEKKEKEQWMLAITKYADRLESDLDKVDYLEKIKIQQRNWIGRSEGAMIRFKVKNENMGDGIEVFTTRPDTLFGVTYLVLAPEHPMVDKFLTVVQNKAEVSEYISKTVLENDIERSDVKKEKTGVELKGVKAVNPANNEEVRVWIADYVLADYGTGAIMAVPAHDERDWDFATKFNLPIRQVIAPFFTDDQGKDAVKKDKKTVERKTAYALVYDEKNDRFLCLDWERFGWHSGIIGGVGEGETFEQAAKREIREETGYTNVELVKELGGEQHNFYFAVHKDVNRYAIGHGMLFKLLDEEKTPVDAEEIKNHKAVWIKSSDMESWLNLSAFEYMWQVYKSGSNCFLGNGILIESCKFDRRESENAKKEITESVSGKWVTKYKLRDWIFSRQRYWGEPIPVIHCEACGTVPVPEKDLPVVLPKVKNYQPTKTGESPLAAIKSWVNVKCPQCKGPAQRETDTMPNWAGSSWYYLRYADPKNRKAFASKEKLKYWLPVDWYNGGMEHTTLHLLYSRFWHKFLYDLGLVPTIEPYSKRTSHGMILAESGEKMSKSKGNVVNPDELIKTFGADSLRLYEMFIGPFDQPVTWNSDNIVGVRRFLEKMWRLRLTVKPGSGTSGPLQNIVRHTIRKVSRDVEDMRFNTAVSSLMIAANEIEKAGSVNRADFEAMLGLLAPFAPHIAEELWSGLGNKKSIHISSWPEIKDSIDDTTMPTIAIQVNGKFRGSFKAASGASQTELEKMAKNMPEIGKWLEGKTVKKVIVVPKRLINFVVDDGVARLNIDR